MNYLPLSTFNVVVGFDFGNFIDRNWRQGSVCTGRTNCQYFIANVHPGRMLACLNGRAFLCDVMSQRELTTISIVECMKMLSTGILTGGKTKFQIYINFCHQTLVNNSTWYCYLSKTPIRRSLFYML